MSLRLTLLCVGLVSLVGCVYEPTVTMDTPEPEAAAVHTLDELEGHWNVSAHVWSDCPAEWRRTMPLGSTEWTQEDDHLMIRSMTGGDLAELWPIDAQTLGREMTVDILGCTAKESLTLVIDQMGTRFASGLYSAQMSHDGSSTCLDLAVQAGLPDSCETLVTWQAIRTH